jgi:hypothetical protein
MREETEVADLLLQNINNFSEVCGKCVSLWNVRSRIHLLVLIS